MCTTTAKSSLRFGAIVHLNLMLITFTKLTRHTLLWFLSVFSRRDMVVSHLSLLFFFFLRTLLIIVAFPSSLLVPHTTTTMYVYLMLVLFYLAGLLSSENHMFSLLGKLYIRIVSTFGCVVCVVPYQGAHVFSLFCDLGAPISQFYMHVRLSLVIFTVSSIVDPLCLS